MTRLNTKINEVKLKRVCINQARILKELGYPLEYSLIESTPISWVGNAFFTGTATCALCPYIEEVAKWLRLNGFVIDIQTYDFIGKPRYYHYLLITPNGKIWRSIDEPYSTYEEALEKCINIAIEIIKKEI